MKPSDFIILPLKTGSEIVINRKQIVTIDVDAGNFVEVTDTLGRVHVCSRTPKGIFIDG